MKQRTEQSFWRTHILRAALCGLLLAVCAVTLPAMAAEQGEGDKEEITISPAVERLTVQPGDMKTGKLKVLNTGEKTFRFTLYARPYSVESEQYKPNYQDAPARGNLYRWVQFDTTSGLLKPGESRDVNYTIMVPSSAEAGGHYSVLFAETVPEDDGGQVVVRTKRVGSIVRLTVEGDIKREGHVTSQTIPWLQTRPPLEATARVDNTGNADFDAETTMRVTTVFGREVFRYNAPHVVYPGKPREITTQWDGVSILGLYRVEHTMKVLDDSTTVTSYVLMVPRWALIVLVMALVAGGVYAAYRRLR